MKRLPLADRKPELELFLRLVSGQTPKRILLIEAPSGFGKTDLLAQFKRDCPTDVWLVSVDLKAAQTGLPYVFWRVSDDLGQTHFPVFAQILQQFSSAPSVNIAGNRTFGHLDIQVALNVDEQIRSNRLLSLHQAFFQDLRASNQRIVIVLDTFNAAVPELDNWISGAFLAAVARTSQLSVVVAGQRVPAPSVEWMDHYEHCVLGGIRNVDDWCQCVQSAGMSLEKSVVAALTHLFDGNPRQMVDAFEKLAREMEG